jgi:Fe2+ or Zn2+ uptake regulation protein
MDIDSNSLSEMLKKHSIKPSHQRLQILNYIISNPCHPTIDQIYSRVHTELPTLSRTTIYNTLKIFVEAGLAQEVTIENKEVRYDARTESHGHFKCKKCGKIYNFNISVDDILVEGLNDFQVDNRNVYFIGICKDSLKKSEND